METNIGRLFSTFAWGLQFIHTEADKILLWDNLDYAQGTVLDRYGANFGVARNGATDAFYRLIIKVKTMSQLSGGDLDTVINAIAELFDIPVEAVDLEEVFPAKIRFTIEENLLTPEKMEMAEAIVRLVKRILAAGVGMNPIFKVERTFEQNVVINTAGAVHSEITVEPQPRSRTYTQSLFYHATAYEYAEITIPPLVNDRNVGQPHHVNLVAYELSEINIQPLTVNRDAPRAGYVNHAAYEIAEITISPAQ
jgi:hypothetical protein